MLRAALRVAAVVLIAGSGLCTALWYNRKVLPYNDKGRYFDAEAAIVLHEQIVTVYGGLALVLALLGAVFWIVSRRV